MSDADPFMVVKPGHENKKMSSYLKKNERGDRKRDVETSSHGSASNGSASNGSVSTRSTATSTAQEETTMFSPGKTPESKSKDSTGSAFGGFDDTSAIEFNSDFGNGLEFGGFGGGGDDGFGTAPVPSNSKKESRDNKKKANDGFDAFNPEAFGGDSFGSKEFGDGFTDNDGFGAFNERQEPTNFGDDGFNAAFGEDSRSQQNQHQQSSKDEAWKKREAWKNQARSTSSSSGNRRGGGHRRAPSRTMSKGDIAGVDNGSGHGHSDDSPRAPRSERNLGSRGEGRPDDNPRAPRSDRHMMSKGHGHPDDNPRAPRSERLLVSRGEGHTDDSPRAPRSERKLTSDRSPIRRNKSGAAPRQRRVAEAPPQRGPPSEPERSNVRPHQRSRRRASLAQPSKSDGNMDFAPRSPAPPQRNKSVDGSEMMDQLSGISGHSSGKVRPRRRGSVGTLESPVGSNTGSSKGAPKEFLRDRSDNQQKIMDMYKRGSLACDQKPTTERLDVSIDTIPDASISNGNHEGGGGLGLGKIFGGKSKKADKLGDDSDHGSGSAGGFVIPDHESPRRAAPRRAFSRKKAVEPKEADYTENRNMEGRSRATLLERVAAAGDKPS
jgi:hypothetical protein